MIYILYKYHQKTLRGDRDFLCVMRIRRDQVGIIDKSLTLEPKEEGTCSFIYLVRNLRLKNRSSYIQIHRRYWKSKYYIS